MNTSLVQHALTLQEIAAWQIPTVLGNKNCNIIATLPALQRGAVWKVHQIEALWDSILRGFPIGAFLLAPFNESLGVQKLKYANDHVRATHHLLDGQQRATGIAIGFLDAFKTDESLVKGMLWIDIANPSLKSDVHYVFRATTHAHPWGYSRIDSTSPLTAKKMRDALDAFRQATISLKDMRPHLIPLKYTWPWDAEAPLPFSMLVNAALTDSNNYRSIIREQVEQLPIMKASGNENQQNNIRKALDDDKSDLFIRLDNIVNILLKRLRGELAYRVPITWLDDLSTDSTSLHREEQQDSIETLFVRVNSAGTRLEGEELIYSLIKSAWIDAPNAIAKLTHQLTTPSRIALLSIRLILAREQRNGIKDGDTIKLVPHPSVTEFRNLIHRQKDFLSKLKVFIQGDGIQLFELAYKFLTEDQYGLPAVLASELAQKTQDVFFYLLCWLDRLSENNVSIEQIDNTKRRKLLGFLTAFSWFAPDKSRAINAIWHDLQTIQPERLKNLFSIRLFRKSCELDSGKLCMIPILHPDDLCKALRKIILGHSGISDTITDKDSPIWKEWKWWDSLIYDKKPLNYISQIYQDRLLSLNTAEILPEDANTQIGETWAHFINTLWGCRPILLYAQRIWIKKWFPDFDPTLPEYLEDKNRPWDFDHIHAQNYLHGQKGGTLWGVPSLIKDWHGSIGNLRAWPLEINRSDSDISPIEKFCRDIEDYEHRYHVTNEKERLKASFIDQSDFEAYWCNSVLDQPKHNYLADKESHPQRVALMSAILYRFLAIYREWYETLKLDSLND